jgi:hypothetical protein
MNRVARSYKARMSFPGMLGGIAGIVMSLLEACLGVFWAALAFGFEASNAGIGLVLMIGVAVGGMACGVLAIRRAAQGRSAATMVIWSLAFSIISALGSVGCIGLN